MWNVCLRDSSHFWSGGRGGSGLPVTAGSSGKELFFGAEGGSAGLEGGDEMKGRERER